MWYRRAAELRAHDDDPWRYLSGLHRKLGQVDAAHEAALKVIEITSRKLEANMGCLRGTISGADDFTREYAADHRDVRRVERPATSVAGLGCA